MYKSIVYAVILGVGVSAIILIPIMLFAEEGACLDSWKTCIGPTRYQTHATLISTFNITETDIRCRRTSCRTIYYNNWYAIYLTATNITCNPLLTTDSPANHTIIYTDVYDTCYLINNSQRAHAITFISFLSIVVLIVIAVQIYLLTKIMIIDCKPKLKIKPIEDSWYRRKIAVIAMNWDEYSPPFTPSRNRYSLLYTPSRNREKMILT